ncbi:MAG: PEP-CTERM sorting domain-containing protein [Akkermansiaceae bacterium]|nr:PEP-CTERM sorting domain-containing protein [Akkermansiaceae bacterium]
MPSASPFRFGAWRAVRWRRPWSCSRRFVAEIVAEAVVVGDQVVDVGDRRDLVFPTYFIELFAGSTLLVQDNSSLTPNDGFLTSTLTYLSPASHPELGQPLQIRLRSTGSGIQQVNFDNVRLDAVPEPSSLAMLAVGAMAFCNFRRRITI